MRIACSPCRRVAQQRVLLAAFLALAVLFAAAPARASVSGEIINRCIHGQPLSGFPQQAYREALANLPTEIEEYSNCSNLIRHAELSAASPESGAAEAASAAAPIPLKAAERTAIGHATKAGSAPIRIGGQLVDPGVVHTDIASALNSLPSSLLALLALLLACALVLAGRALRNRVRARRAH